MQRRQRGEPSFVLGAVAQLEVKHTPILALALQVSLRPPLCRCQNLQTQICVAGRRRTDLPADLRRWHHSVDQDAPLQLRLVPRMRLLRVVEQLVACLLYTSPSPRDLSTSRMPSSA